MSIEEREILNLGLAHALSLRTMGNGAVVGVRMQQAQGCSLDPIAEHFCCAYPDDAPRSLGTD